MRIDTLKLGWFRGAALEARLDCSGKSHVVYGANGSGKSSFTDAMEFIISEGRIGHLGHEYSGSKQELGLRNTHTPDDENSQILLKFEDGASILGSIDDKGNIEFTHEEDVKAHLQEWQLENILLRQDEVSDFVTKTKGEKYSTLLPLLGLDRWEQTAENLHRIRASVQRQSKVESKKGKLELISSRLTEHLDEISVEAATSGVSDLSDQYLEDPAPELLSDRLLVLEQQIKQAINDVQPERKRYIHLQEVDELKIKVALATAKQSENDARQAADRLLEKKLNVLARSRMYLEDVDPDVESVSCPACGREIKVHELRNHVQGELEKLEEAQAATEAALNERGDLVSVLKTLRNKLGEPEVAQWLSDGQQSEIRDALDSLAEINLPDPAQSFGDDIWGDLEECLSPIVEGVEAAVQDAPPSTQELVEQSRLVEALKDVPEYIALSEEVDRIEDLMDRLSSAESNLRQLLTSETTRVLESINDRVQELWTVLHPGEPIDSIELQTSDDTSKAIDINLKFHGVHQPSPRNTLSEGHRNSLGLCVFLALSLQATEDTPLFMDDVVSSFDRGHRGMLVDILLTELADRQVILLTHDREWYSELRTRLPAASWKFGILKPWRDPVTGIQWSNSKYTFDDASYLIGENNEAAGNRLRAIMDSELSIVAEKLKVSVEHARGDRNDRRTCVEFLGRIISEAKKDSFRKKDNGAHLPYEEPIAVWEETRDLLIAWGNRSSHDGSMVENEVEKLIEMSEKTLDLLTCDNCQDPVWIGNQEARNRYQCGCGRLQWRYG